MKKAELEKIELILCVEKPDVIKSHASMLTTLARLAVEQGDAIDELFKLVKAQRKAIKLLKRQLGTAGK